MPRKPFIVTPVLREKVHSLAAVGTPQEVIARMIRCSPKTLRKHFRHELANASAEATAAVAGYLFKNAQSGNVAAQIFWMKTRGGWTTSTLDVDSDLDDPPPPPPAQVRIVCIPDNGRDPEIIAKRLDKEKGYYVQRQLWTERQIKKNKKRN